MCSGKSQTANWELFSSAFEDNDFLIAIKQYSPFNFDKS